MRRLRSSACAAVAAAALATPAAADADILSEYSDLAERRVSPAPLVFTNVPRALGPLDQTMSRTPSRSRRGYALRILTRREAIVSLERDSHRTMRAFLREFKRRLGYRAKRTRVRGRRAYLLTRRTETGRDRVFAWIEDRRVYSVGSGTPRQVSLRMLRSVVSRLEHLRGYYIGSADPATSTEAAFVTTDRTVTGSVSWEGACRSAGSTETFPRVGTAKVALLRRRGNAFSFDIAGHRDGDEPWNGTVSGTIARESIALTVRATGTIDGDSCDTGPLSFRVPRRP